MIADSVQYLMQVRCRQYPNIEVTLRSGQKVRFVNGTAEIPDSDAMSLAHDSMYELIGGPLANARYIPFNPDSWRRERKLMWDGHIGFANGFGKASMDMVMALSKIVDVYPTSSAYAGSMLAHVPESLQTLLAKQLPRNDTYTIKMKTPNAITERVAERQIGFTMFEATKMRLEYIKNLNDNCERILVPSTFCRDIFMDNGINRDIFVVPLGVNDSYEYFEKPERDDFVFSTLGTLTYRKGTDLLVEAYKRTFPKDKYPNVRLLIKSLAASNGIGMIWFINSKELRDDPRIEITTTPFTPDELLEYYRRIDCFVFPTRGEGFGLPVIEAMAMGNPAICTNWSGVTDFVNDDTAYPIGYKLVDVSGDAKDYRGMQELWTPGQQWAEPNLDELCEKMLYVYEHRDKAKEIARIGSGFVRQYFNYDAAAAKLVQYLDDKF